MFSTLPYVEVGCAPTFITICKPSSHGVGGSCGRPNTRTGVDLRKRQAHRNARLPLPFATNFYSPDRVEDVASSGIVTMDWEMGMLNCGPYFDWN